MIILNSKFPYYDDVVDYDWLHKGNGLKIHDLKIFKNGFDKKNNIIQIWKGVKVNL